MINMNIPDLVIPIKSLNQPAGLSQIMAAHGIKSYAYSVKHKTVVLKFGFSNGDSKHTGERIYRQIANLPGWGQYDSDQAVLTNKPGYGYVPRSPSGKDMECIALDYQKLYNVAPNKDACVVEIWDTTLDSLNYYTSYAARAAENELFNQYEAVHKCLPIGNVSDTRGNKVGKSAVPRSLISQLFA